MRAEKSKSIGQWLSARSDSPHRQIFAVMCRLIVILLRTFWKYVEVAALISDAVLYSAVVFSYRVAPTDL